MAMIIAMLAQAAVLAAAAPPPAPDAPPAVEAKPAAAADPVVCRKGMNATGSHMRVKPICMKKSEWAERARDDAKLIGKIQAGSQTGNKTPGTAQ